ncbi:MAG: hypothetical protein C0506_04735 [Anaerolinea sp.]|nr:hypothetical protein [Anaerolinea sp.]
MTSDTAGGRTVFLDDGRALVVRKSLPEDSAAVAALSAATSAYFLCGQQAGPATVCGCTGPCQERDPAVVAVLQDGTLVAAAWLHRDGDDPAAGTFRLSIQPAFSRAGVAPVVLRELAEQAAQRGITRMRSWVGRSSHDPVSDCRGAGLTVLSAMSFGGVTEVVLGAPGVREAALV